MKHEKFLETLNNKILPFWLDQKDIKNGGFFGAVTLLQETLADVPKGGVMTSRYLWTFSALSQRFDDPDSLSAADHAYDFLMNHLWDDVHGGIYWMVDYKGNPLEEKKITYAQSFAIYGLSEYAKVRPQSMALKKAIALYEMLEEKVYDAKRKLYREEFTRDWTALTPFLLTHEEKNASHTTNTLLHLTEAYTNLYLVWPDEKLKARIEFLITAFTDHVFQDGCYCAQVFDDAWMPLHQDISYGHDIETAWLLQETSSIVPLGEDLKKRLDRMTYSIARTALEKGLLKSGALASESSAETEDILVWWVQAEAVIGFYHTYEITGEERFKEAAVSVHAFIEKHFIDPRQNSEWFSRLSGLGEPLSSLKGNFLTPEHLSDHWKGPYHTVRYYIEMIKRLEEHQCTK